MSYYILILYYIIDIIIHFYNSCRAAGERGGQDGQRPRRREGELYD